MNKIYFALFIVFIIQPLIAQAPAIQWQKCLGGSLSDNGYDFSQTSDGGYIVSGISVSTDGDITNTVGGSDFCVFKLNADGALQWQKNYGGTGNEWIRKIIQTADGGYMMVGSTMSANNHAVGNHGGQDGIAIKTDVLGNVQWSKCYGGSETDDFDSVRQIANGSYVISGATSSINGDVSYNHGTISSRDAWVLNLGATGNIIWEKTYGSQGIETFRNFEPTTDGGFIFIGDSFTNDYTGDVTQSHGLYDVWIVRTDAAGTMQWQKSFGGSWHDQGATVKQTTDGSYIVAAITGSSDGDVTLSNGQADLWVIKLDQMGNMSWQKCYGGTQEDTLDADGKYSDLIIQAPDGNYIFGCGVASNNGNVIGNHGSRDFWAVKIDADGTILWQKCMGGSGGDSIKSIVKTSDGSVAFCGNTSSQNGDVSGNHSINTDMWVVKLVPENLAVKSFADTGMQLYPNPAASILNIGLPQHTIIDSVSVNDIFGKRILMEANLSQIYIGNLAPGTYLVTAVSEGKAYQAKFIKQ
jgi:hypothetical protein